MKIADIRIRNFRSLKEVSLEGLQGLTVLFGENSSGKSNVLEAIELFFTKFSPELQTKVSDVPEFLWFDRDTKNPIEIEIAFDLSEEDVEKLGGEAEDANSSRLRVTRHLLAGPSESKATLVTQEIRLGNVWFVRAGKLTNFDEAEGENSSENEPTEPEEAPPVEVPQASDNPEGANAENPDAPAEETPDPEPPTAPPPKPPPKPKPKTSQVVTNLAELIGSCFKLVPSMRHQVPERPSLGQRESLLPVETRARLLALLKSGEREDIARTLQLEDAFAKAVPLGIREIDGVIQAREGQRVFPVDLIGGGTQELLGILLEVVQRHPVLAIEEPELHLHPTYERILLSILREIAADRQIIIATHSDIFLDEVDPELVWSVRKHGTVTRVERVGNVEGLAEILDEVGYETLSDFLHNVAARPSTIYLSPRLLLVDRTFDKVTIPRFAKKLGVDFEALGVKIEELRGIGNESYHLQVWAKLTQASKTNVAMIISKQAQAHRDQVVKNHPGLLSSERVFVLEQESLMDCLPDEHIRTALRAKPFSYRGAEDELDLTPPKVIKIEDFLKEKDKNMAGWEFKIALRALQEMSRDELPEDLRSAIIGAEKLFKDED